MKVFVKTIPILAILGACDPTEVDSVDPVEFRANPEALYLTQYDAQIDLVTFAKMVVQCDGLEKLQLAVTWSAYEPNPGQPERVVGFGFSVMSKGPLYACYKDMMLDMGAHP